MSMQRATVQLAPHACVQKALQQAEWQSGQLQLQASGFLHAYSQCSSVH